MDMNTACDLEARQHCPNARVVYDLLHVIGKYGREVMSRVRMDAAKPAATRQTGAPDGQARALAAAAQPGDLKDSEQMQLDDMLDANQSLMAGYVMRNSSRHLWTATTLGPGAAPGSNG